jgi:hypothetical protein
MNTKMKAFMQQLNRKQDTSEMQYLWLNVIRSGLPKDSSELFDALYV